MKKILAGWLVVVGSLLGACAPAGASLDEGKVAQEIDAYRPLVQFVGAEDEYVVVTDASTGDVQQQLDQLQPDKDYFATFSTSLSQPQIVKFKVQKDKQTIINAPTLNLLTDKQASKDIISLANYNINKFYLVVTKDGQALTSISQLPSGNYTWYFIRSGYTSTPVPLYLSGRQQIVVPELAFFKQDAIANLRIKYASSGMGGGGGGGVFVKGYYRSNGTYVSPHYRSSPRR